MPNPTEFSDWCRRIGLPPEGQRLIDQIRSSPPSRRVRSGSHNVPGRAPSNKTGLTVRCQRPARSDRDIAAHLRGVAGDD